MKFSKQCPKCGSKDILTNKAKANRGERSIIPISSFTVLVIHVYVCMQCGFFEEYIDPIDLQNKKKIAHLRNNWTTPE